MNTVNRPDYEAMTNLLNSNKFNAVGVILRLAWKLGLMREEIFDLTWDQIDLHASVLHLGDRRIPLSAEMREYLINLRERNGTAQNNVLISDKLKKPMAAQHISRVARTALDTVGLKDVRLIDLRHDYIIRMLAEYDIQEVAYICQMEPLSLQLHFAEYLPQTDTRLKTADKQLIDEERLADIIKTAPPRLALAVTLTWEMGLTRGEMVSLTWRDAEALALTPNAEMNLRRQRAAIPPDSVYVFPTPNTGGQFTEEYFSKKIRADLIQAGLPGITLRDLYNDFTYRKTDEPAIMEYAAQKRSITTQEVVQLLNIDPSSARTRLRRLCEMGRLEKIGIQYYLAGEAVPAHRHEELILAYLRENGFAYRQDIAQLLRIEPRQAYVILRDLKRRGLIRLQNQKYLPAE